MFDWFKSKKAKTEKEITEETQESLTSPEELRELIKTDLQKIEGYKKLMMLYNAKRAEAAKNRDDAGIDYYMNKLDDMRNLAKKLTLSR